MDADPRWPNLFLVGAPKAGTTTLHHHLAESPDVWFPAVKEPLYFAGGIDRSVFVSGAVTDRSEYLALYSDATARFRGDASPQYLADPTSAAAIAAVAPTAHVVVSLRDPVERAFSHWLSREVRVGGTRSFDAAVDQAIADGATGDYTVDYLVEPGFYHRHLSRWWAHFDRAHVHLVFFDDLVADEAAVVEAVWAGIGAQPGAVVALDARRANAFAEPRGGLAARVLRSGSLRRVARALGSRRVVERSGRALTRPADRPTVPPVAGDRLTDLYRSDSEALGRALGRPLPWGDDRP